jgi:hypothetical protein
MGVAAVVGNPPFQGGQKITGALGTNYREYLVEYEEVLAGLFEKGAKGKKGGSVKDARKAAKNGSVIDSVMSEGTDVGARFTSPSGVGVPFTNPSRSIAGEDDVQQGTLF